MTQGGRHSRTPGVDDDSAAPQTEGRSLNEGETRWPLDPDLVRLVHFINTADSAEIGLTLHVKGCVVSGVLISGAQYYRLLVKELSDLDRLSEQSNRELAANLVKFYRPSLEMAEKNVEETRAQKKLPALPRHIHFRRAQTIVSGQAALTQSLWRGRLAEVDGWSFGNFGATPPSGQRLTL
jgi:hypothetical protein